MSRVTVNKQHGCIAFTTHVCRASRGKTVTLAESVECVPTHRPALRVSLTPYTPDSDTILHDSTCYLDNMKITSPFFKLENVAIAIALQLDPQLRPDAAQSLSALISSPVSSLNSLSLSVAVLERFYCLYVSLCCDLEL